MKENFKADYIIDIIQGKETSEVQAHLHEDLEAVSYTHLILFQGTPEELAENQIVREKYLSNSCVLRRKDVMK